MTDPRATESCPVKPARIQRPQPISVNGVSIPRAAIARETQNHPAAKPVEAWLAAARALIVRELLLQEARRLEIIPEPIGDDEGRRETEEEALMRQLVARMVVTPAADEAACQRYFSNNRSRFRAPDIYETSHILIAARPDDKVARAEARQAATVLLARLLAGEQDFAAAATEYSACPSGRGGGNLGQIGPGQTVPEFEAALRRLPVGDVGQEPVETRYGFHVVRVERRIEGRPVSFEMAREHIAAWLTDRSRRTAIRQYIGILAGCAHIEGFDLGMGQTPLVQ